MTVKQSVQFLAQHQKITMLLQQQVQCSHVTVPLRRAYPAADLPALYARFLS
jgi:hypothetical protein